jgi:transposase
LPDDIRQRRVFMAKKRGEKPDGRQGGRFSSKRKREAVLRLLRGEDLELVSRELGVTAAKLSEWRDAFLNGAEAALRERATDEKDLVIRQLREKVGQLAMDNELLEQKIERMEAIRPFRLRRPGN